MKIYITKKDPREFVRSGLDCVTVWFRSRPEFNPGHHACPVFGMHDILYPKWQTDGIDHLSGRTLRKMKGELALDIWQALLFSYNFDQEQDLYEPVREYYDSTVAAYRKKLGNDRCFWGDKTELNEKLRWYHDVRAQRLACMMVEKEGQRWWEWCLEYDVQLELMGE